MRIVHLTKRSEPFLPLFEGAKRAWLAQEALYLYSHTVRVGFPRIGNLKANVSIWLAFDFLSNPQGVTIRTWPYNT